MYLVSPHSVGILNGEVLLFSHFENGGEMWSGRGEREKRVEVRFKDAFRSPPVVTVGLSMWDIDTKANQRLDIRADEVNREGFTIVFRTWGDTQIARARAQWMAIGAVDHVDGWET
ncbi:H-type lectin domain-containing protein [Paracoccus sp. SCSIO 75233]|uniref:H-type lectin domain-containing protein n=1 Tax=Paracoccus sp. SCSIO 75233 TaxID=3017782 RepID=UPI0022F1053C|nr:H-type lectin domain-containing protein [Paracoccus sp. SCSIO 75233]WBU54804.1 H-type lectin domain-containing protein [Paracoccus sp. SCSIO 75233]